MTAPLPAVPSLHEVEAFSALQRACGHGRALSATLDEATNALARAGLDDFHRQIEKLRELERYVMVRLDLLTKRVAGGAP